MSGRVNAADRVLINCLDSLHIGFHPSLQDFQMTRDILRHALPHTSDHNTVLAPLIRAGMALIAITDAEFSAVNAFSRWLYDTQRDLNLFHRLAAGEAYERMKQQRIEARAA